MKKYIAILLIHGYLVAPPLITDKAPKNSQSITKSTDTIPDIFKKQIAKPVIKHNKKNSIPITTEYLKPQSKPLPIDQTSQAKSISAQKPSQKIEVPQKLQPWINSIKEKTKKIGEKIHPENSGSYDFDTIKTADYQIKSDIYDVLTELKKMTRIESPINQQLQKASENNYQRTWYQRWFNLSPRNPYQYFEVHIFPLIAKAPIYQDLADQGVLVLVAAYQKEIVRLIKDLKKTFKFKQKDTLQYLPFFKALRKLKESFSYYQLFLENKKKELPIGSLNRLGSSKLFRYAVQLAIGGGLAGTQAAKTLKLDVHSLTGGRLGRAPEIKTTMTKAYTQVAKKSLGVSGWIKGAFQYFTTNTAPGLGDLKELKNVKRIATDHRNRYIESLLGKTLATVVAAYLGYKLVQWLMKDWPRKQFVP